jgi:hypothetical protein
MFISFIFHFFSSRIEEMYVKTNNVHVCVAKIKLKRLSNTRCRASALLLAGERSEIGVVGRRVDRGWWGSREDERLGFSGASAETKITETSGQNDLRSSR